MKTFTVFGYDDERTIQRGNLIAEEAYDLADMLEAQGFVVVLIKE